MIVRFLITFSLVLSALGPAVAENSPKPTEAQILNAKLALRESELAGQSKLIALQQMQASAQYRKAISEIESANEGISAKAAALGKLLGCEVDPQTADCKPKPAEAKKP